jgi:hypothetical protein
MLVETGNNNLYYARHLPRLSDLDGDSENLFEDVEKLLQHFAFTMLEARYQPA